MSKSAPVLIVLMLALLAPATSFACDKSKAKAAELPKELELPGDQLFPESVFGLPDGTLLVGSLATGEVLRVRPKQGLIERVAGLPGGVTGVFSHDGAIWVCRIDQRQTPPLTAPVRLNASGREEARFAFPGPAFCNDFAADDSGALYVSDSYGKVWKLAPGAKKLALLAEDPLLAPSTPDGYGANGIAWDGAALYVTTTADGRLLRVAADGAVTAVDVSPPLSFPDGIRAAGEGTLLVAQATGSVVRVEIQGDEATSTPVAEGLSWPSGVAIVGDVAWVSEGQLGHLFGMVPGPPTLPFKLHRVEVR